MPPQAPGTCACWCGWCTPASWSSHQLRTAVARWVRTGQQHRCRQARRCTLRPSTPRIAPTSTWPPPSPSTNSTLCGLWRTDRRGVVSTFPAPPHSAAYRPVRTQRSTSTAQRSRWRAPSECQSRSRLRIGTGSHASSMSHLSWRPGISGDTQSVHLGMYTIYGAARLSQCIGRDAVQLELDRVGDGSKRLVMEATTNIHDGSHPRQPSLTESAFLRCQHSPPVNTKWLPRDFGMGSHLSRRKPAVELSAATVAGQSHLDCVAHDSSCVHAEAVLFAVRASNHLQHLGHNGEISSDQLIVIFIWRWGVGSLRQRQLPFWRCQVLQLPEWRWLQHVWKS